MRRRVPWVLILGLLAGSLAQAAAPGYHLIKKIPLGGEGGWDYLTVDGAARRLYVSRATHVVVVDLDTEKPVGVRSVTTIDFLSKTTSIFGEITDFHWSLS